MRTRINNIRVRYGLLPPAKSPIWPTSISRKRSRISLSVLMNWRKPQRQLTIRTDVAVDEVLQR